MLSAYYVKVLKKRIGETQVGCVCLCVVILPDIALLLTPEHRRAVCGVRLPR